MNKITLILIIGLIIIVFNWLSGYISTTFLSSKYESKESKNYLASNRLKFKKLIRDTKKLRVKSEVLRDNRSFLRKVYSTRCLHILIVTSEINNKDAVLWVEILWSWSLMPAKKRELRYFKETNTDIINHLM